MESTQREINGINDLFATWFYERLGDCLDTHHAGRALCTFLVTTGTAHSALRRTRSHINIVVSIGTRNGPRSVCTSGTRQTELFACCVLFVPVGTTLARGESIEIIGVAPNRAVSANSSCFGILSRLTVNSIHHDDELL